MHQLFLGCRCIHLAVHKNNATKKKMMRKKSEWYNRWHQWDMRNQSYDIRSAGSAGRNKTKKYHTNRAIERTIAHGATGTHAIIIPSGGREEQECILSSLRVDIVQQQQVCSVDVACQGGRAAQASFLNYCGCRGCEGDLEGGQQGHCARQDLFQYNHCLLLLVLVKERERKGEGGGGEGKRRRGGGLQVGLEGRR